jgi:hypothetical protein
VGLYTGDQPALDANLSATATMPGAIASMGQHCDDVVASVPDHSVRGRLPLHSPSLQVVPNEGISATPVGSAADSVVIESLPGSASSGLSLQLNLGLSPPSRRPVTAPSVPAPSPAFHAPFGRLVGAADYALVYDMTRAVILCTREPATAGGARSPSLHPDALQDEWCRAERAGLCWPPCLPGSSPATQSES